MGISDGSRGARSGPRVAPVGAGFMSRSAASMGNDNTSVAPVLPRNDSLSSAMSCSVMKMMDISVPPRIPSAANTAEARFCQRSKSIGRSVCSSDTNTSGSTLPPILRLPPIRGREESATTASRRSVGWTAGHGCTFVRGHDVANNSMAHNIARTKVHEGETLDAGERSLET